MKKRNLTYLGGLAALAVAVGVLGARVDVDSATDALAAVGDMSIQCNGGTQPTLTAYVPAVTLEISGVAPALDTPTLTTTLSVVDDVNGADTPTEYTDTVVSSGTTIRMSHNAPRLKMGGFACHDENQAQLTIVGVASAYADYSVYGSDAVDSFSSNQLDATGTKTIYGSSGIAGTSAVTDGDGTIDDTSTTANGEVVIGGNTDAAGSTDDALTDSLWRLNHSIKFLDASTDIPFTLENMAFSFTAS